MRKNKQTGDRIMFDHLIPIRQAWKRIYNQYISEELKHHAESGDTDHVFHDLVRINNYFNQEDYVRLYTDPRQMELF